MLNNELKVSSKSIELREAAEQGDRFASDNEKTNYIQGYN